MPNILINNKVRDLYLDGMSLNDAIGAEFGEQIHDIKSKNDALKDLNNIRVAMFEAGIKTTDHCGKFMDAYTSGGMESNDWLFPAWMETKVREAMYAQDILPFVVTNTMTVDSNIVQHPTLNLMEDKNKKAIKRSRIAEGADIPIGKISIGQASINLWKRGRGIEMTYEAMRRMRIDLFAIHMNAIATDLAHQNLEAAADVLYNGDGNNNAATSLGTTDTTGTITNAELVHFMIRYYFETHMKADTLIANEAMFEHLMSMTYDMQLAYGATSRFSFNAPQLDFSNLTILAADVPENTILVSNKANTLMRYQENGSNIQENQRYARNQTELMTFTENSGYAINVAGTNRFITIKS